MLPAQVVVDMETGESADSSEGRQTEGIQLLLEAVVGKAEAK